MRLERFGNKQTVNGKNVYKGYNNTNTQVGLFTANGRTRVYYDDIEHKYTTSVNFANTRNTPEQIRERREGAARARERARRHWAATIIQNAYRQRLVRLAKKSNKRFKRVNVFGTPMVARRITPNNAGIKAAAARKADVLNLRRRLELFAE
jgi:flagellin-like hook-associated protein FlgL